MDPHAPLQSSDRLPPTVPYEGENESVHVPDAELLVEGYRRPTVRARPVVAAGVVEAAAEGPHRDAAEGSYGPANQLEVVIGADDRVAVQDPQVRDIPWRQICALRIHAADGANYVGTGWLIGPRLLATAGHCVFMHRAGGWVRQIDVIPGRVGNVEPFGRVGSELFASVHGWVADMDRNYDYGVIFVDEALGSKLGNFAVQAQTDADLSGRAALVSGYPADLDHANVQYFHERSIDNVTPTRIFYEIDTYGGQSGSPVWRQIAPKQSVAVGIHTTGTTTGNSGTRITEPVLRNLIQWNEAAQ